ncbi:UNKNOWN [Stylonychia lemnae]|uniref:TLDc domain-containing protein n=1 Tax=Stylonychia lemnae TaxID=5949 RepID=A0A078A859_STYLE|nr:UNKNOWN [Stylonychia lemnae]|eukprot:CDW77767.1 UNKNOWN [Stylonychia lemnae]
MTKENQEKLDTQTKDNQIKLDGLTKEFQLKLENQSQENQAKLTQLSKDNQVKLETLSKEYQGKLDVQLKETEKFKNYAKELEQQKELLNKLPQKQFRRLVDNIFDKNMKLKLFQVNGQNKLLYKATRDGFQPADFHRLCDNQGPTVSFIQSEHGEVFGGYTSVSWTSENKYSKDSEAFVFSLTKNTLHKQYQNIGTAIGQWGGYFMIFGHDSDIYINSGCNVSQSGYSNLGGTYMPPEGLKYGEQQAKDYLAGSYQFKVIEIEVYSVTL